MKYSDESKIICPYCASIMPKTVATLHDYEACRDRMVDKSETGAITRKDIMRKLGSCDAGVGQPGMFTQDDVDALLDTGKWEGSAAQRILDDRLAPIKTLEDRVAALERYNRELPLRIGSLVSASITELLASKLKHL